MILNQKLFAVSRSVISAQQGELPPGEDLIFQNSGINVGEQDQMMGRGVLKLQKSDGWCQKDAVKHMQPLALLGHPIPCLSVARCAWNII